MMSAVNEGVAIAAGIGVVEDRAIDVEVGVGRGDSIEAAVVPGVGVATGRSLGVEVGEGLATVDVAAARVDESPVGESVSGVSDACVHPTSRNTPISRAMRLDVDMC